MRNRVKRPQFHAKQIPSCFEASLLVGAGLLGMQKGCPGGHPFNRLWVELREGFRLLCRELVVGENSILMELYEFGDLIR
jgi:hypothetical protein